MVELGRLGDNYKRYSLPEFDIRHVKLKYVFEPLQRMAVGPCRPGDRLKQRLLDLLEKKQDYLFF